MAIWTRRKEEKVLFRFSFKKVDGGASNVAPDTDIAIPCDYAVDIALFAKNA